MLALESEHRRKRRYLYALTTAEVDFLEGIRGGNLASRGRADEIEIDLRRDAPRETNRSGREEPMRNDPFTAPDPPNTRRRERVHSYAEVSAQELRMAAKVWHQHTVRKRIRVQELIDTGAGGASYVSLGCY